MRSNGPLIVARLQEFQKRNDLSDEGVASLLSERLGEEFTAEKVKNMKVRGDRRVPKKVVEALDLEPLQDLRVGDEPPEPGPDNPIQKTTRTPAAVPDELDWRNAREAVIAIYVAAGKGVSMILKKPDVALVFAQGAPVLADDWIALARVDERTRAVLAKLTVVGPGGKLAMDHMILITKLVSISGGADGRVGASPTPEQVVAVAADGDGAGGPLG